jgi:peptide deformylase
MARLPIVLYPHPALTTPSRPVEVFDDALARFLDDMAETMYAAEGVGLAANQVASLQRVTVIDCAGEDDDPQLLEIVNPEIVDQRGEVTWREGCLSFPGLYNEVKRAAEVVVRYQDRTGAWREVEADGLLAVALQHEIDHLDGVVFTERLPLLRRRAAMHRWRALRAQVAKQALADPA